MPIISLSLNEKILEEIDELERNLGFSGRSEVVRAAVRHFIEEKENANALSGKVNAVLIAAHSLQADEAISGVVHRFDDIIVTHLHSKTSTEKCLETFIVSGEAERIKTMFKTLQSNKKADYVKLLAV